MVVSSFRSQECKEFLDLHDRRDTEVFDLLDSHLRRWIYLRRRRTGFGNGISNSVCNCSCTQKSNPYSGAASCMFHGEETSTTELQSGDTIVFNRFSVETERGYQTLPGLVRLGVHNSGQTRDHKPTGNLSS